MKTMLSAALLLFAVPLAAQTVADPKLPEWMAGTWMMQDGASWSDEVWTDPRGGIMLGVSRSGFGPDLQGWEVAQIKVKTDGRISLFAQPQGKAAAEFPMVLISEEAIEFANPAHDYPQRIRYWRQGKLLMAEISLMDGSRAMRWNFRPVVPPQDEVE
ncbi:MAG TPA: DUF6265 family protein [Novosphingobium sp.]|nr:DUF6265 family protein [Novosphingobium sp.]HQA18314.1 DUF6265 family protein [Novosphingobium sp.]